MTLSPSLSPLTLSLSPLTLSLQEEILSISPVTVVAPYSPLARTHHSPHCCTTDRRSSSPSCTDRRCAALTIIAAAALTIVISVLLIIIFSVLISLNRTDFLWENSPSPSFFPGSYVSYDSSVQKGISKVEKEAKEQNLVAAMSFRLFLSLSLWIFDLNRKRSICSVSQLRIVHICEATFTKRLVEFENTESASLTLFVVKIEGESFCLRNKEFIDLKATSRKNLLRQFEAKRQRIVTERKKYEMEATAANDKEKSERRVDEPKSQLEMRATKG
ncbi:hypothetical protein Ahy_B08g090260 [Arachis hypogaea]|uniref:Uncharacterized protein n=1 Tax=Arachis hypogaea TaxID=3818 RepID=A0A444XZV7_ARAHY|nr:hypothetical protein Ahy_B08g090260 [Arachis hypogaea]